MPEDVELNDSQPQPQPDAPAISSDAPAPSTLHHLKEIASVIEAGSLTKEVHRISLAVRLTVDLRRRIAARDVAAFLAFALPPSSDALALLSSLLPKFFRKMGVKWMLIWQLQRLKFQSSMVSQRLKYIVTCLC